TCTTLLLGNVARFDRWRQRLRIDIAARAVGTDPAGTEAEVRLIDVVLAARVLVEPLVWLAEDPRPRVVKRLRVELRILDERVDVDMLGVGARPSLHDMQRVAVGVGVLVDPDLLVLEPDRVDHERVAFPAPDFLAKERRIRVVRMFVAVYWD